MPSATSNKEAPRLLIAHRYMWPENLSLYPEMLKHIAEWHKRAGYDVTILTSAAHDGGVRRAWANQLGVRLIEASIPNDRGQRAWRRCLTLVGYSWLLLRTLLRHRYELVHVSTYPPVAAAAIVRLLSRVRGYSYLYVMQDHFPEMLGRQPSATAKLVSRIASRVDRANVDSASLAITLSDAMRQTLLRRGCHGRNISVLQNFSVDSITRDSSTGTPTEPPTLVFAGNHGAVNNLQHFLESVAAALHERPFRVRMIGWGSEAARLKEFANDLGLKEVSFHGTMPRLEAQEMIAGCDAGVVAAEAGLFDVAYPSKTTSYLTAGIPLLVFVEPESTVAESLRNQRLGVAASPTDPQHAASAIVALLAGIEFGVYQRDALRQRAQQLFSSDHYFAQYAGLLASKGLLNGVNHAELCQGSDRVRRPAA